MVRAVIPAVRTFLRPRVLLAIVAIVAALLVVGRPGPAQGAASIVVDTTLDEDVDNAICSLREAIIAANTNASYHGCAAAGAGVNDQITFNVGGTGTPAIEISSTPLPPITEWVTIDGGAGRVAAGRCPRADSPQRTQRNAEGDGI
jgi:CSLREA domain-containing protein